MKRALLSPMRPVTLLLLALLPPLLLGACSGGQETAGTPPAGEKTTAETPAARPSAPRASGFPFTDVTARSGIDFVHDTGFDGRHLYVETMTPGVALFDADGDGDLDLYVVNGAPIPGGPVRPASSDRFFVNRGDGTFEDATEAAGLTESAYGMGVTVGDADGDGRPDLYVMNYGPNVLYLNRGPDAAGVPRFETVVSGAEDPRWSVSGAFFDADADGDLDLYVANYLDYDVLKEGHCKAGDLEIYCSPEQYPPIGDRLYRNDGGGRFTDISEAAGVVQDTRGMGVAVGDVDHDGDQDLYVANDRSRNLLYLNGGGRLEEVGAESGVGYSPMGQHEGGMGASIADFTGSGAATIFLTNFQKESNRLFVDAGGGFFDDHTLVSGLGFPSTETVSWGMGTLDVEGDGDLDLAVGNGHVFENAEAFIPGSAHRMPDHLFLNRGDGRFELEEFPGPPLSSRGVASGDLDGDGDPDLVIASCGGPLRVWRNETDRPERFLILELRAAPPNPAAYGAQVTARVGDRVLRREVAGGGSYGSQSDTRVYLGLGDAGEAASVEVRWPDGSVETATAVSGGRRVVWRQGEGILETRELGAEGQDRRNP